MPYISQEKRRILEPTVQELVDGIVCCAEDGHKDGLVNFAISSLVFSLYGRTYSELNAAIGILECVKQELYRRVVAPYEDKKCSENGEVFHG